MATQIKLPAPSAANVGKTIKIQSSLPTEEGAYGRVYIDGGGDIWYWNGTYSTDKITTTADGLTQFANIYAASPLNRLVVLYVPTINGGSYVWVRLEGSMDQGYGK